MSKCHCQVEYYDTLGKEGYGWGQRTVGLAPPGQTAGFIVNLRFDAAWEIHLFLVSRGIPYAIIGGTALPRWGEPGFTKDVDLGLRAGQVSQSKSGINYSGLRDRS